MSSSRAVGFSVFIVSLGVVTDSYGQTSNNSARVIVRPSQEVVLSTDLSARIASMPFVEGRRFREGDVLVQFDCKHYKAEAEAAWAAHAARKHTYEVNAELDRYEAIGTGELAASKAEVQRAKAQARSLDARIRQCEIKAPFSGVVIERYLKQFESARSGSELLRVMDDARLELELIVPSSWLRWLKLGDQFQVTIDETGNTYGAELTRVAATVDAVSQTVKLTGKLHGRPPEVLPGMSGTADFDADRVNS